MKVLRWSLEDELIWLLLWSAGLPSATFSSLPTG